jgi:hypothetical protein
VPVFKVLAALLAILMLARHGRRALALFRPPDPEAPEATEAPGGRAAAVIPLLNCVIAGAVLWVAVKGLLSGLMNHPGGTP